MAAVSTIVNRGPLKAYVFRNYNFLPGIRPLYLGGCQHQLWQAIRATSAAPGYFQEFTLGDDLHQVSHSLGELVGEMVMRSMTHFYKVSEVTDCHQSLVGETVQSRSQWGHTRSEQNVFLRVLEPRFSLEIDLICVFSLPAQSFSVSWAFGNYEHNHASLCFG